MPGVPTFIRAGASSRIFAENQVCRLIEGKRLPAGKRCDANGDALAGDAK
jgi:hypothetical protein